MSRPSDSLHGPLNIAVKYSVVDNISRWTSNTAVFDIVRTSLLFSSREDTYSCTVTCVSQLGEMGIDLRVISLWSLGTGKSDR